MFVYGPAPRMLPAPEPPSVQELSSDYYSEVSNRIGFSRETVKRVVLALSFTPGGGYDRYAHVAQLLCQRGITKRKVQEIERVFEQVRDAWEQGRIERFTRVTQDITIPMFPTWQVQVKMYWDRPYLVIHEPEGKCNVTGEPLSWNSRKWMLSHHMTDTEIVNTAWLAVKQAVMHELGENFLYHGIPVFNPHMGVDARMQAAQHLDVRA
jgi:hypothetical protein